MRRKEKNRKRNPIAKAAKRIRPHIVPDKRRRKLARAERKELSSEAGE